MKRSLAVALVATLAFLGTACGDDDDTTATEDDTSSTTAPEDEGSGDGDGEQAAGDGEFCPAIVELLAGDPEPEQIREVAALAPDPANESLETIAAGFEDDPDGYFGSDEFNSEFAEVMAVGNDECADEVVDVTTVEYAFQGLPEQVGTGVLGVNLTNEGNEWHEMILFRKNDDTAESFEEIFAMEDQDAAEALVTDVGATFIAPGTSGGGLFDVSEPGEYAVVCFIPVGTTSPEVESDGPPHFTQGMLSTFTVG